LAVEPASILGRLAKQNHCNSTMQLRGRTVVLGIFALAILMAAGAWWRRLQESRHAAEFWGERSVPLVVGNTKVSFLVLGDARTQDPGMETTLGRPVEKEFDLTDKPGMVHFRYALTQDANFEWDKLRTVPLDDPGAWAYALRFTDGTRTLHVVLEREFHWLGIVDLGSGTIKMVACPRLAPKLKRYLTDVKAPLAP
jgi:hypothetical protein